MKKPDGYERWTLFGKLLFITGGYNSKEHKLRFLHPLNWIVYPVLLPILLFVLIFIDENIITVHRDNYCWW